VGIVTGILVFLLALQMGSQFSHPAARLTPDYAVPHLVPATILWLCSVLVPACLLASAAIPILPLVGISMSIWLGIGSLYLVKPEKVPGTEIRDGGPRELFRDVGPGAVRRRRLGAKAPS
jgi:hypothetical protein